MTLKDLPIGTSDFQTVRSHDLYYVDKSLLAQEVMNDSSWVIVLPRPRRFGKTLNLSMLRYFFDRDQDYAGLFEGLAIEETDTWQKHQGKYPVLFLTLKDCKGETWEEMQVALAQAVSAMCVPHRHLANAATAWLEHDPHTLTDLIQRKADLSTVAESIAILSKVLHRHTGQEVVVLIDEYDSGLIDAYQQGYYPKMLRFMQKLLGQGLKDNKVLRKGVVTGILRVAKESLFSGINNLTVATVLNKKYADKFGLTRNEVTQALANYGLADRQEGVDNWYNGYQYGDFQIFNPWSILNFLRSPQEGLVPYWVNTSSNDLIYQQLDQASPDVLDLLQNLVEYKTVIVPVADHTVFGDLDEGNDVALFTFLVFSGYLNAQLHQDLEGDRFYRLAIPNKEVRMVFRSAFRRYLSRPLSDFRARHITEHLLKADWATFQQELERYLLLVFSHHDVPNTPIAQPERTYHAFMLGLLAYLDPTHTIKSNREVGFGRADVTLVPRDAADRRAYVLEFKRAASTAALEATAQEALAQIIDRAYTAEFLAEGRQVYALGLAFHGKQVCMLGSTQTTD